MTNAASCSPVWWPDCKTAFCPRADLTVLRVAALVLSLLTGAAPFLALGYALLWVLAPAE